MGERFILSQNHRNMVNERFTLRNSKPTREYGDNYYCERCSLSDYDLIMASPFDDAWARVDWWTDEEDGLMICDSCKKSLEKDTKETVKKACATCGKESEVGKMKVCMHMQLHRYVCDSKCMENFYKQKG